MTQILNRVINYIIIAYYIYDFDKNHICNKQYQIEKLLKQRYLKLRNLEKYTSEMMG